MQLQVLAVYLRHLSRSLKLLPSGITLWEKIRNEYLVA